MYQLRKYDMQRNIFNGTEIIYLNLKMNIWNLEYFYLNDKKKTRQDKRRQDNIHLSEYIILLVLHVKIELLNHPFRQDTIKIDLVRQPPPHTYYDHIAPHPIHVIKWIEQKFYITPFSSVWYAYKYINQATETIRCILAWKCALEIVCIL